MTDCCSACSVTQESMMEVAVEEYAVEITQKALDVCHSESRRLVFLSLQCTGTVCLSTLPWRPHYQHSKHIWRLTYMYFHSNELILDAAVVCFINTDWLGGNTLVSVNEVTLCRAWLVEGWVTVCGQVNTSLCNQPLRPTQPSALSGTKLVLAKVQWCSGLGSKGRYGSFYLWINMWVTGKTVIPRYHVPYLSALEMSFSR